MLAATGLLGAAGCTATDGQPVPAAESRKPTRPMELSLDDVDPCVLFSSRTLDALDINKKPRRGTDGAERTCLLTASTADPMYDLMVTAHTGSDMAQWVSGEQARPSMSASPLTISGFPAVRVAPADKTPGECAVVVSVAADQALQVRLGSVDAAALNQEKSCDLAKQASTAALEQLRKG